MKSDHSVLLLLTLLLTSSLLLLTLLLRSSLLIGFDREGSAGTPPVSVPMFYSPVIDDGAAVWNSSPSTGLDRVFGTLKSCSKPLLVPKANICCCCCLIWCNATKVADVNNPALWFWFPNRKLLPFPAGIIGSTANRWGGSVACCICCGCWLGDEEAMWPAASVVAAD